MARTDIMGLLTGATQPQIDPRVKLTPAQQRMQFAKDRARGMEQGFRGMLGLGESPQAQIQSALAKKALQQAKDAESGIGQVNVQFYTPESVQAFNRHFATTGQKDYSLLKEPDLVASTFKKKQTEANVAQMKTRSESFANAQNERVTTAQMRELLDSGLETGALASVSRSAQNFLKTMFPDMELKNLEQLEVFDALSNRLALMVRNPKSDMGLPGSTSNKDLKFLVDAVPNLGRSTAGNRLLLEVYDKMYQLKADTMAEQRRIIKENGGVPPLDLTDRLNEFVENYNILGDDLRNRLTIANDQTGTGEYKDFRTSLEELNNILRNEGYTGGNTNVSSGGQMQKGQKRKKKEEQEQDTA